MFIINLLYDLPCFISLPAPSVECFWYVIHSYLKRLEVASLFNLQTTKVILVIQSNMSL